LNNRKNTSLLSGFDEIEEKEELDKEQVLEHYNLLELGENNKEVLDFLRNQTFKIHKTTSKAYTQLGEIFYKTQQKLAKQNTGVFEKWLDFIGFNKMSAYRLINRNKMLRMNEEKKIYIESLPITLSYEISSPSCPEELRQAVLNGEIKTLKIFKEQKSLENQNEIKDVTPITFDEIKSTYNKTLKKYRGIKKFFLDEKIDEEKKLKVKKILGKIENDYEKLYKLLEEEK